MNTTFSDIFKAWDRFARALAITYVIRLENARRWRSRFVDAVRL